MASELRSDRYIDYPTSNTSTSAAISKGDYVAVGVGVGIALTDAGTAGSSASTTYPQGPRLVLALAADKALLDKSTASGDAFDAGADLFWDSGVSTTGLVAAANATTSARKVGRALEAATTSDTQVLGIFFGHNPMLKAS